MCVPSTVSSSAVLALCPPSPFVCLSRPYTGSFSFPKARSLTNSLPLLCTMVNSGEKLFPAILGTFTVCARAKRAVPCTSSYLRRGVINSDSFTELCNSRANQTCPFNAFHNLCLSRLGKQSLKLAEGEISAMCTCSCAKSPPPCTTTQHQGICCVALNLMVCHL